PILSLFIYFCLHKLSGLKPERNGSVNGVVYVAGGKGRCPIARSKDSLFRIPLGFCSHLLHSSICQPRDKYLFSQPGILIKGVFPACIQPPPPNRPPRHHPLPVSAPLLLRTSHRATASSNQPPRHHLFQSWRRRKPQAPPEPFPTAAPLPFSLSSLFENGNPWRGSPLPVEAHGPPPLRTRPP
ncbi:hypothetical protein VIGAN_08343700, partial [Vigna angularis var. angularis]